MDYAISIDKVPEKLKCAYVRIAANERDTNVIDTRNEKLLFGEVVDKALATGELSSLEVEAMGFNTNFIGPNKLQPLDEAEKDFGERFWRAIGGSAIGGAFVGGCAAGPAGAILGGIIGGALGVLSAPIAVSLTLVNEQQDPTEHRSYVDLNF